ncbi:hypothetical protein Ndes2526B_g03409 [Nannochloris sp. 'desiccata']
MQKLAEGWRGNAPLIATAICIATTLINLHALQVNMTLRASSLRDEGFYAPATVASAPSPIAATIPTEAFFITLPTKEASNWTHHAKSEVQKISKAAGITTVHTIFGEYNTKLYGTMIGKLEQVGLSLAHMAAWKAIIDRNLPGGWIFEDDVVAHEHFAALFPSYWALVPNDYEVIWLGHLPIDGTVSCENRFSTRLLHEDFVYCTHAMIVSRAGAERLVAAMEGILTMSVLAERVPDKFELKIDLFINYVGEYFLPKMERHKWVIFDAAPGSMAAWGGHKWCRTANFYETGRDPLGTCCEMCDIDKVLKEDPNTAPLMGTGLVYQNLCKEDPDKLEAWRRDKT